MKNIKLIVLDVDGTLTDGKIYIDNSGVESKAFNVKDGMAIAQAIKNGIKMSIVTGRESDIVNIRSKELGIVEIHQRVHNKVNKVKEIVKRLNIKLDEVCYLGDDINDLMVMKSVGFSACPMDAVKQVREQVNYISNHKGGEGAVREVIELILDKKGIWKEVIKDYRGVSQ